MTAPLAASQAMPSPVSSTADATLLANAIRALAMDAVQAANSGHPGMPMGMAEIAVALWKRHLRHNPAHPHWPDRDRFVLSNGHGSMLQYALLHLTGYALPIDEIKRFRQLQLEDAGASRGRRDAGRRNDHRSARTGARQRGRHGARRALLAAQFNRPGHDIVDHHTYVFVGDGCLMEGISHEACSLAGTLGLAKLIVLLRRQRHLDRRRGRRAGSPTTRRAASRRTAGT